jgi:DNA-binding transcriptional ArsR family regulator
MEYEKASSSSVPDPDTLADVLADGPRKRVLTLLSIGGKGGMSFKELAKNGGLPPTTLAYHLKVLTRLSLVEKGVRYRAGRRDYSVYTLSTKGVEALSMVSSFLEGSKLNGEAGGPIMRLPRISVTYAQVGPRCLTVKVREG